MAPLPDAPTAHNASPTEERRAAQVKRYATRVTLAMIVVCNGIILLGIWGSGVDLENIIQFPDEFNPKQDACLRYAIYRVEGSQQPVRLCSEWINFGDPTRTHTFQSKTKIIQGADGELYFDHGPQVDYRLFMYFAFAAGILAMGILLNRHLIARYRTKLESSQAAGPRDMDT